MTISEKTMDLNRYFMVEADEASVRVYELNMMIYNDFNRLIRAEISRRDDVYIIMYRINGLQRLSSIFSEKLQSTDDICRLFYDVLKSAKEVGRYLLDASNLLIDSEYIMYDANAGKYKFIYVPGINTDFREQIKKLMEYIIETYNHSDEKIVMMMYDLYGQIIDESFSPAGLLEYLDNVCEKNRRGLSFGNELCDKEENKIAKATDDSLPVKYGQDDNELCADREIGPLTGFGESDMVKKRSRNTAAVVIALGAAAAVMVLCVILKEKSAGPAIVVLIAAALVIYSVLSERREQKEIEEDMKSYTGMRNLYENVPSEIRVEESNKEEVNDNRCVNRLVPAISNNNKIIVLRNGSVLIGRIKSNADYHIADRGVSRIHANIVKNENIVMISDMNSTNGTYVNDVRVCNGKPVRLKYGDRVRFAEVEYYCV